MSNKTNTSRKNNAVIPTNKHGDLRKSGSHTIDEKNVDLFNELAIDIGRGVISTIKENAGDYKAISEDEHLSSVDKALGKRKVLAVDIVLSILAGGGTLSLTWLAKKVFAA